MKKEFWKPILNYEGLYEVSNFGRVRSFDTYRKGKNGSLRICKGRILKPFTDKNGYLQVCLCKNGKRKTFKVHRLVAEAFIQNPNNLPEVNHKDENKQNNNVENLEFCDRTYNVNYGTRNERDALTKSKPILQFTLDGKFVREWKSTAECGRNGFDHGLVSSCCRGERQQAYGYKWVYKKCL